MRPVGFVALSIATASLLAAAPLAAATTVTSKAPVTIRVSTPKHDFYPQVIRIPGGVPVRLVISNPSGTDHDFDAPEFFAAAQIDENDAGKLDDGKLEVLKHSTRAIRLIARPGHYDLKSSKALDVVSGMQGQILVR